VDNRSSKRTEPVGAVLLASSRDLTRLRVISPAVTVGNGVHVRLRRLDPEVPMPHYAHPGDAGADLVTVADVDLAPGERTTVGTGIAVALPEGFAAFVHPRSGLAARVGLSIVNTPGTVDAGYRGEIRVCLINHDLHRPLRLRRGDRIAQLVVQRVERVVFDEVAELPESVRGDGGYGSTGVGAVSPAGHGSRTDTGGEGR
jgi:dUTP diphosphatase